MNEGRGNDTLLFASQSRVAVGRVYVDGIWQRWKRKTERLAHTTRRLFLIRLASLSSTLLTRSVPHRCTCAMHVHRQIISLINGSHRRRRPRTSIHPYTLTHATDTLKVPPPTAVHPIASRFLSRAVPPYTPLYLSQLSRSLPLSLILALSSLFRILVTHLPIISQSS